MSRIPKELRITVDDAYHPKPKGKRPSEVRIGKHSRWGAYERNRLLGYEAWQKAGSVNYGKLPISIWITLLSYSYRNLLHVSYWYDGVLGSLSNGVPVGITCRLRLLRHEFPYEENPQESVEVLIRREDLEG